MVILTAEQVTSKKSALADPERRTMNFKQTVWGNAEDDNDHYEDTAAKALSYKVKADMGRRRNMPTTVVS